MRNALFRKCDGDAVNIGAVRVAHEGDGMVHCLSASLRILLM
jgi:hypothetical protein